MHPSGSSMPDDRSSVGNPTHPGEDRGNCSPQSEEILSKLRSEKY